MKTLFYVRSAYSLSLPDVTVPQCFIDLDNYFDTLFITTAGLTHESVTLAENLCRRMADVELYAHYVSEAQTGTDNFRAAIIIGTFLVGYFNACKSLLDAGAIALAKIYNLELSNKEMDFSKIKFWKQLDNQAGPTIKGRYASFTRLFDEIIKWRDAAIHRLTPFVVTHSPGRPDKVPREKQDIKMVAQPDISLATAVKKAESIEWVEPLHYHKKWRTQLIEFCKELCLDIQSQTLPGT